MVRRITNIFLTVMITLGITLLSVFVFNKSWLRLFETLNDFGSSIKYYFCMIFCLETDVVVSTTDYSNVFDWCGFLPNSSDNVDTYFQEFFRLFFDRDNFMLWFNGFTDGLIIFFSVIVLGLPCLILFIILLKFLKVKQNNNFNKDTMFLCVHKWLSNNLYTPVIRFIRQYIWCIKENNWLYIIWALAIGINLNLGSIVVGFFAYYFYFSVSFDIGNIWVQISKLVIDLQVVIKVVPVWLWVIIGYIIFDWIRKKRAINKLRHMEAKNCGFVKDLPIVSMTNGTMGKKKTTMITDMALSQEVMFRQKAFEILQKNDVKFPYFPWICFELELKACMRFNKVYNLATIKDFIEKKKARFNKHQNADWQLYGYDIEKYGRTYNNGLYESDLFDVLETYAKAYFIYVIECSLIVSNYSIREDNVKIDTGNFPMWVMDFFPEAFRENNRHAHILDFDTLRLGKKVIEDNPNAGSFEFGVVVITEIGKERGNNLELKEIKKNTEETNQKNDLFNSWLKMCRHSATVDNFPFIKVFTDEQRPESWGADARDLCDILNIVDSGEMRLAMPFYTLEETLSEMVYNKFYKAYYDFRFRRGDNTLLMYLYKTVASWLFNRNLRLYNRYGYSVLTVEKESGTQDGKKRKKKYFIVNMKT